MAGHDVFCAPVPGQHSPALNILTFLYPALTKYLFLYKYLGEKNRNEVQIMANIKKDRRDNKILKERNPEKNFDETRFMADIVLFFCERSLDEIRAARRNEEMTAACSLYSMINLMELRETAGFNCDFGLIDRYRDIILKKTMDSLRMMGVQTSETYRYNPYMTCTFTAACVDMDAAELDRIGNSFTTKSEFKTTYTCVLSMILANVIYQSVYMVLRAKAVKLPAFMHSGWPQLILAAVTLSGIMAATAYYFRRCIASLVTEWKIRRRLLRSMKEKSSHVELYGFLQKFRRRQDFIKK